MTRRPARRALVLAGALSAALPAVAQEAAPRQWHPQAERLTCGVQQRRISGGWGTRVSAVLMRQYPRGSRMTLITRVNGVESVQRTELTAQTAPRQLLNLGVVRGRVESCVVVMEPPADAAANPTG